MFDEHKEIYLFFAVLRPNSITVKSQSENRKLNEETLVSRKVYFSHRL